MIEQDEIPVPFLGAIIAVTLISIYWSIAHNIFRQVDFPEFMDRAADRLESGGFSLC